MRELNTDNDDDDDLPEDIAEEQALARKLRAEPGLFKGRHRAPNIFITAWRTPGELATLFLLVQSYILYLFAFLFYLGPEQVRKIPGIIQCAILAALIIPAWITAHFVWRKCGLPIRNIIRVLIRLWPVNIVVLLVALKGFAFLMNSVDQAFAR